MVIIIIVIVDIIICYQLIIGCMFFVVRYFDFLRQLMFRLMTKHPEDTAESTQNTTRLMTDSAHAA